MTERSCWDSFDSDRESVVERLTALVNAGHARRIRVEHDGYIVAEFPLGAVAGASDPTATRVATVSALVDFLDHCTVQVEHVAAFHGDGAYIANPPWGTRPSPRPELTRR